MFVLLIESYMSSSPKLLYKYHKTAHNIFLELFFMHLLFRRNRQWCPSIDIALFCCFLLVQIKQLGYPFCEEWLCYRAL